MTNAPSPTKVFLVIHTTCGIEFELVPENNGEPDFSAKSLSGRVLICADDDEETDAEEIAKEQWTKLITRKGWELVGECWS